MKGLLMIVIVSCQNIYCTSSHPGLAFAENTLYR